MLSKLKTQKLFGTAFLAPFCGALLLSACQAEKANPQTETVNATQKAQSDIVDKAGPIMASEAATQMIAQLKQDTNVAAAFADLEAMNEKNITRLIEITEIPAPPFAESKRAKDYAKRLRALGLTDVSIDDVGNVIARRQGHSGNRTIAIGAHIDTVFPIETDVTVRREGNVFYAPGIGDNSQGLVLMLALVEVMEKHNLETDADILFIGTVGEEGLGNLSGMRHLFRDGASKIDAFIAIDGGRSNRIVQKAVGSHRYRVEFNGPGGHSYGGFGRAHPHQALAEAIATFTESATPITQSGTKSTFSVGRIGGGTSINSIPFKSWMEVDMRSTEQSKIEALDAAFQKAVQIALANENARRTLNDALTMDIQSVGKRPAGMTPQGDSLVQNAIAASMVMGLEPELTASSTDANIPMSLGVPAITLSRGGISKNAHAPNESWENKDPHIAAQIALLTVLAEAGH
jgi:acetylornithine deacetylase/succinyl-diaminopimelate desuccinylase-like protein